MKVKPALLRLLFQALLITVVCLGTDSTPPAQGAEGAIGVYLLGYNSSIAGVLPPTGLYLRNDFYAYQGTAKKIPLSGRIEADLRCRSINDLITLNYVTPNKILGADYAVGISWGAVVNTFIKGRVESANIISRTGEGDFTAVGDMFFSPIMLGWHLGQFHILASGNVVVPVGAYNSDRILNTGLNRWAILPIVAVTWLQPKYGQECSVTLGYNINLRNYATKYTTGHELTTEFFLGQHLPKGFALGLAGYFYQQVTGDSGAGAGLGAFMGQALAIGPCVTYSGKIGKHAIGVNLRYYNELTVTNRLHGQSFFGTLSFGF